MPSTLCRKLIVVNDKQLLVNLKSTSFRIVNEDGHLVLSDGAAKKSETLAQSLLMHCCWVWLCHNATSTLRTTMSLTKVECLTLQRYKLHPGAALHRMPHQWERGESKHVQVIH